MVSSSSKDYPVVVLGVYSFGLGDGDGEGGVDTRTTHLNYQKVDCWIDGGNFLSSQSRE